MGNIQNARIQGEWKVEVTDEGDCFVRIPGGHDWCFGDLETTDTCCFAVAHLVAAAPDLLTALKAVVHEIDINENVSNGMIAALDMAEAAVLKAEGK